MTEKAFDDFAGGAVDKKQIKRELGMRKGRNDMAIQGRSTQFRATRVRLGMVGGGEGAFIGAVHRLASRIDDHYDLVAGALSSTPDKARRSGEALGSPRTASTMTTRHGEGRSEATGRNRGGGDRHAQPHACRRRNAFLKAGIHVICDKPLTASLKEAKELGRRRKVRPHFRADPQLHRLSDGAAGARHGRGRRAWRDPPGPCRVSAGLADRGGGKDRAEAGADGGPIPSEPARAARSATSARTPINLADS